MKVKHILCLLSAIILLSTGCSNDEPKGPQNDFSKLPDLEKILPGVWVSLSEEDGLYRYEFSNDGSYQVFIQASADNVALGSGSYVADSKAGTLDLKPVTNSGEHYSSYHFKEWSKTQLTLLVPTQSGGNRERVFHRIACSIIDTPGSDVSCDMLNKKDLQPIGDVSVLTPHIISFDESTKKFKILNSGAGYSSVESEDGVEYIEIIGSPITKLPYDFFNLLVKERWGTVEKIQDWIREYGYKDGISNLGIVGSENINSYVEDVVVTLSDNIPQLAVYIILNRTYPLIELCRPNGPNSICGYYDEASEWSGIERHILGWSPSVRKLYFCINTKELDRDLSASI